MRRQTLYILVAIFALFAGKAGAQTEANEYYFRNVESGLWLGPANSWGTRASLLKHPYWFRLKSGGNYIGGTLPDNGQYNIESQVANNNPTAIYLGGDDNNPFLDNGTPWLMNITKGADGYYTLQKDGGSFYGSDGSSLLVPFGPNDRFKWRIRTYLQMVSDMLTATAETPKDATFLIKDPDFSLNNRDEAAWTYVASNMTISGGAVANSCAESYHSAFSLTQTINGVPNGKYRLKAQGFYRNDAASATTTVVFPFADGKEDQVANEAAWISASGVDHGDNLVIKDANTSFGQTLFDPFAKANSINDKNLEDNSINFRFTTKENNYFTPTHVSFKSTRYGTNGGYMDVYWVNSDGTTVELAKGIQPARNNADPSISTFQYDIDGAKVCGGGETCRLRIVLYSLDNGKQVGLSDITIDGTQDVSNRPYFFANNAKGWLNQMEAGQTENMVGASAAFTQGKYFIDPIEVDVTDNTLNIGVALEDNTRLWCIWDNFSLEYLGNDTDDYGAYNTTGSSTDICFVEYMGAGDDKYRWLTNGSYFGMRAILTEHPQYLFYKYDESTGTYTFKSQVTGDNNFLGSNGSGDITDPYMDRPDPGIAFTLQSVTGESNTFYLSSNDTFYTRSAEKDANGYYGMVGNNSGKKWEIFTREQMMAMLLQASEKNPADVTWLVRDHSFGRNNRDVGSWSIVANNSKLSDGNNENNCAESYHSTFTLTQTISNVPNGIYELKAQGFYRQDGSDNDHLPVFYINGKTQTFPLRTGTENSMSDASVSFSKGNYFIEPIRVSVTNGTIELGAKLEDNTGLWCIWDNFELTYLGNPFKKEDLINGIYYLRNVGAPEGANWMCSGTRWDTRVSMLKHPQYMYIVKQGDGTFTMETHVGSGTNVYFGNKDTSNPFVNKTAYHLNITPVPGGYYTIGYDGKIYGYDPTRTGVNESPKCVYPVTGGTANSQWEFLTHQQMINIMLTGTRDNPQDATWLIKDFDFGSDNRYESSWQGIGGVSKSNNGYNTANQNLVSNGGKFNVYQTLVKIPNGKYKVRAQAAFKNSVENTYWPVIYASSGAVTYSSYFKAMVDEAQDAKTMAGNFEAEYADGGKYWTDWIWIDVTSNYLVIGAADDDEGHHWAVWDNMELYYIGPLDNETATSPTYDNVNYSTSDLKVLHKPSFLIDRANALAADGITFPNGFLQPGTGMKLNMGNTENVQEVSEYVTTHYVRPGEASPIFITTNNGTSNSLHEKYQRWYYFDDYGWEKPLNTDILAPMIPSHYAYLYQNGLVMGTGLTNQDVSLNGGTGPVLISMQVKLPLNKERLTICGDISRYSDLSYATKTATTAQQAGNLTEPSLTLRHVYHLIDAKVMARDLTARKSVSDDDDNWMEEHTIHFPSRTIGLMDDHVPLDLELRDYWFFRSGNADSGDNSDLQNIKSDEFITITTYYPDGTNLGIRNVRMIEAPNTNNLASDLTKDNFNPITNTEMLRRRLINFGYPFGGEVPGGSRVQLLVKAHNPELNEDYNLARFTIIFDSDSETLPWMDIVGETAGEVSESAPRYDRSSESLRKLVDGTGPVAHIDFDFPSGAYFSTPEGTTRYSHTRSKTGPTEFKGSSALPFDFARTSYSFSAVMENDIWYSQWGDYAISSRTQNNEYNYTPNSVRNTISQNNMTARPVSDFTLDMYDPSLEAGFLFIDASDLPGTVATIPFEGTLCQGSKLMCTGWMASRLDNYCRNPYGSYLNMPGSVILKVMGINSSGEEEEVYAFCPGQVGMHYRRAGKTELEYSPTNGDYVWQQFYFDFSLSKSYPNGYVLRVENNCESTNGGDYFLDDIWVFAQVPTLEAERTAPLCGGGLEVIELNIDYATLLSKTNTTEAAEDAESKKTYMTMLYLDWDNFMQQFLAGLKANKDNTFPASYTLSGRTIPRGDLTAENVKQLMDAGAFETTTYFPLYKETFLANIVKFDDDPTPDDGIDNRTYAYGNFLWSNKFGDHEEFDELTDLTKDADKVFRTGEGDSRKLVFNGSFRRTAETTDGDGNTLVATYQIGSFEFYHNYALLTVMGNLSPVDVNAILTSGDEAEANALVEDFNVCSQCAKPSPIYFTPKMEVVGTVGAMSIDEVEFCQDTDITFAMELTGLATRGGTEVEGTVVDDGDVVVKNAFFDWWLGDTRLPATVENYNTLNSLGDKDNPETVFLHDALRRFRLVYPMATSLFTSDIKPGVNDYYESEPLTQPMIDYLRALAAPADGSDPRLIIHQKVVVIHATEDKVVHADDGKDYVYFVAVPIEENIKAVQTDYFVACADPLPFRVLVKEHAPKVREGFTSTDAHAYDYPADLGTLSIRIAKSQFEKVRYDGDPGTPQAKPLLHIPLRNVEVKTDAAIGVQRLSTEAGRKVRLTDTNDGIMQQYILDNMSNMRPPAVGTIDYFLALRDDEGHNHYTGRYDERLAKVHFSPDFKVREGYSYTLRMYYEEAFSSEPRLFAITDGYTPANGKEETILSATANETTDITLTFGNDGSWAKGRLNNVQLDDELRYFVSGGSNPKDSKGAGFKPTDTPSAEKLPVTGTYYKFQPTTDGVVKAGVVLNASKPLYLVNSTGRLLNDDDNTGLIVTDNGGIVKYLDMNYQLTEKLTGFVQFNVVAGETYYLFSSGSKLGFLGFYFNGDGFPVTCEGTMDIILKIVPDYEVWTAAAGNMDWNNDENWRRADYDELYAANGTTLRDTYLPNGDPDNVVVAEREKYNYITADDRKLRNGFAPLYCTNILMMTDEKVPAAQLYDEGEEKGFPKMFPTASSLIRYDFQCHEWNKDLNDAETDQSKQDFCFYKTDESTGETIGDMVTELYASNQCSKIVFQPETELLFAHHLNYDKAWVEYAVEKNRWHLLGSPLKDMLSAEWYAPTYSARQETTYYEPVRFDEKPVATISPVGGSPYALGYDRFSPAVYQRTWDKAKAVIYERGAEWSENDNDQDYTDTTDPSYNTTDTGHWQPVENGRDYYWQTDGSNADEYLQRLTYKPMGVSKANVAVKGSWSGVYNDHTVPFDGSGFSVMPINNLKGNNNAETEPALFRLPKEDYFYDVWDWNKSYNRVTDRTRVYIKEGVKGKEGEYQPWPTAAWRDSINTSNTLAIGPRGRLRTDDFVILDPTEHPEDTTYTVRLRNEGNGGMGYFLVANPFICGLDMQKFFQRNTGVEPYYLVLRDEDIAPSAEEAAAMQTAYGATWTWTDMSLRGIATGEPLAFTGESRRVVPARYAFFVKSKEATASELTVTFTPDMMAPAREYTLPSTQADGSRPRLTIRAERDKKSSMASVELSPEASNTFRQQEDMETFVVDGITNDIPVVYTLCGRLATSINRLHDFTVLPIGIESNSHEPVTLTFSGVDQVAQALSATSDGPSVTPQPQEAPALHLYDAQTKTLFSLKEGTKVVAPGNTQNRFFIVTALTEQVKAECNIVVTPQTGAARILSTTGEPLTHVAAYDMSGRIVCSAAPHAADFTLTLPKGIYVIAATTAECQAKKKIIVN